MLPLYTVIILALGSAAEQLLNGENPVVALIAAAISMLLIVALWRVRVIVKREGRWQMDIGLFRMTIQGRVLPAPPQAYRRSTTRSRGDHALANWAVATQVYVAYVDFGDPGTG